MGALRYFPRFIFVQGWLRQNAMSTQDRHGNSVALPLESTQRANRSSATPRLLVLALRWFELADRADYLIRRAVTAHRNAQLESCGLLLAAVSAGHSVRARTLTPA